MGPIRNPYLMAVVAAALQWFGVKHPEYRDLIEALMVGLGFKVAGTVIQSINGGLTNGKNGNSSSHSSGPPVGPTG